MAYVHYYHIVSYRTQPTSYILVYFHIVMTLKFIRAINFYRKVNFVFFTIQMIFYRYFIK